MTCDLRIAAVFEGYPIVEFIDIIAKQSACGDIELEVLVQYIMECMLCRK